MLRLHSASDGMISHIKNYAKEHDKRKNDQIIISQSDPIIDLHKKINELEAHLAQYEQRKAESLCQVIDALSPPAEQIKLIPIYKRLNFIS